MLGNTDDTVEQLAELMGCATHKIKKLKFTLSFASPEKENYYFIYYAVIVKQKIYKRSSNYYSRRSKT